MQIQPEVNVENELKRLLTEVTARRQTGPEELWVHDAFDITVLDIDGDNSRSVSTQQWEAIFSHCSLTTLNWCALPCTAELFDIFASHPKLKLKTLILPGNVMLWRRDYVLQERHEPQPISSSNRFAPVLYACPNLTNLEVRLSDQRGDDQGLLLGNSFLQDIAKTCPKLERLALVEASNHHGFGPSNAFTNEGIAMLVGLPRLHVLALHGVNCSSATLLSLATRTLSRSEPRMRIDVTLGGRGAVVVDIVARFHETLLELVDLLLLPGVNEYPGFVIHVQLDTHNHTLPAMWEMRFMPEWSQLKRDLTRQAGHISFSYDLIRTQATIECRALAKS
ncbi:hypothetical protein BBJ28_00012985 [Nothophytophthora sp. Chile5]|nr:hypothetical protein BBJ28_00012985 [Nothophytophthora sp. Chile5]